MKESIYFPASVCPLHLWHENLINTVQDKTWLELYYSIKAWKKTLNELLKCNTNWKLNIYIKSLMEQENFLSIEDRIKIINKRFWDVLIWNDTRNEIEWNDFDWIVIWSDNFNLMVNSIKRWKKNNFKFKKIYLYERIWYNII